MTENIAPGYQIIQDWTNYEDSLISTISPRYYKLQGIKAFSKLCGNPVPNEISNSYPHAKNFIDYVVEYIKYLENLGELEEVKILDLGCGSGIFARHCLIAAQKANILEKIKFYISDFSKKSLNDLKQRGVLKEFKEGEHYELIEMDIFDHKNAKKLDGSPVEIKDFSLVTANYLFSSLPSTVIRPKPKGGGYEKLQYRLLRPEDGKAFDPAELEDENLTKDSFLIDDMLIDSRWVEYNRSTEKNEWENEFYDFIDAKITNHLSEIIYSFGAMKATEIIMDEILNDDGVFYATDVQNRTDMTSNFKVFSNAVAHFINEPMVTKLVNEKDYNSFITMDLMLLKMLYYKNRSMILDMREQMANVFLQQSPSDNYKDLRGCIAELTSPFSNYIFEIIHDEFLKIDDQSCFSYLVRAQNLDNQTKFTEALSYYKKAQDLDFLNDFDFSSKLAKSRPSIKPKS